MAARCVCLPLLLLLTSVCATARAEESDEEFPYTAYVNVEGAYYRSGPGASYYPTGKLPHGEEVEVYRHDRGGWYAIRPPLGSFSWVAGKHLKLTGDRLGMVMDDDVTAAVGSTFSDIREVQQVRLDPGEEVEVLETVTVGDGQAAETWHRIAPPAGEFRWISRNHLSLDKPPAPSAQRSGRRNLLIDDESQPREMALRGSAGRSEEVAEEHPASKAERAAREPAADSPRRTLIDGWLQSNGRKSSVETSDTQPESAARRTTAAKPLAGAEAISHELDLIDLELSHMVAEEPSAWSFDDLRGRAESALTQTSEASERTRARTLVNRIKKFEELKLRHADLADRQHEISARSQWSATPPPGFSDGSKPGRTTNAQPVAGRVSGNAAARIPAPVTAKIPAAAATSTKPPATSAPVADDRFDGVGKLTRVVSQKAGMPQYALVDEAGAVRQYVTSAPGVNLRRYIGHQVGVTGMKGYLPELSAHHVTAKSVTALDGRVLR